jgi:hypothetical protein
VGSATLPFEFKTARPGNPLFCHQEFLERVSEHANSPIAKRVSLLLQRMLVDESRLFYKTTQGVNRGWRRSRLRGGGGKTDCAASEAGRVVTDASASPAPARHGVVLGVYPV